MTIEGKIGAGIISGGKAPSSPLTGIFTRLVLALTASLILFLILTAPARADVLSEMEGFWRGAAVNTTGPTAFNGQASGHWTLGNLYLRAPVHSEPIATVSLPSFRAGCGGIDAFAGAFSFIDSDQLIAFGRAVAQNAAGFAFELALETISPVIAETMAKLRALAQWVNNQNLNSCETAQALVGAAWSRNDQASAAICAAIGTSQGIFSDYAAARHGCGSGGKRNSTLAAASGPLKDQAPVNVNYAWRAVKASSFLSADPDLAEFAMSVSGTVIVTAPLIDGDLSGPRVRVLEPLALDRRVTEILMEGGGDLPVYRCDAHTDCLNPVLGQVTIPADQGFRGRVATLLRRLVEAVRTDTAPPADALGLVNLTTLPVYRVINTAAAYRGAVVDQEGRRPGRGGGARRASGLDLGSTPRHRGAGRHPRHRRRDAIGALAEWPSPQPDRVGAPPPRRARAFQHRAWRYRKAAPDRNRACRGVVGRSPRRPCVLPRRGRCGRIAVGGVDPCTSSIPWAAAPIWSIC